MPLGWFLRCQLLGRVQGSVQPVGPRVRPRWTSRRRLIAAIRSERPSRLHSTPGNGSFDHRPPLPVLVREVAVTSGAARFDEFAVMFTDPETLCRSSRLCNAI